MSAVSILYTFNAPIRTRKSDAFYDIIYTLNIILYIIILYYCSVEETGSYIKCMIIINIDVNNIHNIIHYYTIIYIVYIPIWLSITVKSHTIIITVIYNLNDDCTLIVRSQILYKYILLV